jgi:hypothetical protein
MAPAAPRPWKLNQRSNAGEPAFLLAGPCGKLRGTGPRPIAQKNCLRRGTPRGSLKKSITHRHAVGEPIE